MLLSMNITIDITIYEVRIYFLRIFSHIFILFNAKLVRVLSRLFIFGERPSVFYDSCMLYPKQHKDI